MTPRQRQELLDQLAELVSTQSDMEACRRRLIHQLYTEGDCSLRDIGDAAGLSRQAVRYLLLLRSQPDSHGKDADGR